MVQASHPLGCDLPRFLLPESPLLDRPLPKLEFHSPRSLPQPPLLTEATLCKEVTLQRHTQGHLKSGQSGSISPRDFWGEGRSLGLGLVDIWPWTRAPGRPRGRCPLRRQVLLQAGILRHRWGPASRPGSACQGPVGCHPRRQGGGDLPSGGHQGAGVRSQRGPPAGWGSSSAPAPSQFSRNLSHSPCPGSTGKPTPPPPPQAGGDKSGWHLPGVEEGCWLGQVDAARGGEPEPGRPPAPWAALLSSLARLSRSLLSWCGGGGRGGGGRRGRLCVCAPGATAASLHQDVLLPLPGSAHWLAPVLSQRSGALEMASFCPPPTPFPSPPFWLYLICCHLRTREQAGAPASSIMHGPPGRGALSGQPAPAPHRCPARS